MMDFGKKISFALVIAAIVLAAPASAQQPQKPNILVIMADDIGYWNISAYNRGMMGYHTPNIDRIANDGAIFTDDPVLDVSDQNDWSQVRVWNPRAGAWGTKIYPVQGFIGPGRQDPRVAATD